MEKDCCESKIDYILTHNPLTGEILMTLFTPSRKITFLHKILSAFTAIIFVCSSIVPPSSVSAQGIATVMNLPVPGTMLASSQAYFPVLIKGIEINPTDPLMFDFIMDTGDTRLSDDRFEEESSKLVKYFLAALTVPEDEMWVNLSPYEKDRIIPGTFGHTEMGRDLLAQDYILKQLAASLMYPEDELGQKFWKRVYKKAEAKYGTVEIPMNTFNKVWILPKSASVYECDKGAFVVDSHLKVMLEEDYLALSMNQDSTKHGLGSATKGDLDVVTGITAEVVREVLIPEIEREVNEGEHFAKLRQIYNAMILATWYKKRLHNSLLGQVYADQNKVDGIRIDDEANQEIYDRYVEAFKKGVYNYIKEDYNETTQEMIPRKYFSGGAAAKGLTKGLDLLKGDELSSGSVGSRGSNKRVTAGVNGVFGDGSQSSPVSSGKGIETVTVPDEQILHPIKIGTSGWRDQMDGQKFTFDNVGRTVSAVGSVMLEQWTQERNLRIGVTFGGREMAEEAAQRAAEVLETFDGIDVVKGSRISTTPGGIALTRKERGDEAVDLDVHFDASHNAVTFNGIKFFVDGVVAPDTLTTQFAQRANDPRFNKTYNKNSEAADQISEVDPVAESLARYDDTFSGLEQKVSNYLGANEDVTFVLDAMHGASPEFLESFESMGVEVVRTRPMKDASAPRTYSVINDKTGQIETVTYKPEPVKKFLDKNAFKRFKQEAVDGSLYMAIDGDSDRLAIWVKKNGQVVEMLPNDLGILFASYLIDSGRTPIGPGGATMIVKTQPTTYALFALAKTRGLEAVDTPVGSKWFAQYINDLLIAVEESGHIVMRIGNEVYFDDAVAEAMLLLEIMANMGQDPVTALAAAKSGIKGYDADWQYLRNDIELEGDVVAVKDEIVKNLEERPVAFAREMAQNFPEAPSEIYVTISNGEVKTLEEFETNGTWKVKPGDGIHFKFSNNAWVQFRLSGTEPIIRLYAEGPTVNNRAAINDNVGAFLQIPSTLYADTQREAMSSPVMPRVNPTKTEAWKNLKQIAKGARLKSLYNPQSKQKSRYDLRELTKADPDRGEKYTIALDDSFEVDFSKNLIDDETLEALLQLADETELQTAIEQMFKGKKINETEGRAVLHTALRNVTRDPAGDLVAANGPVFVDGKDVMPDVISVLNKMEAFTKSVRSGEWKGASGKRIENVVNIGIGGSDLGPKMGSEALKPFGRDSGIKVYYVSNIDGSAATEVMRDLDPANMFEFWDWVGGRYSVWSAVELSLATYIGFDNFLEMLEGAREMDEHFRYESFENNIPVLKALLSIWNNNFLGAESFAILPYDQYMSLFPAFSQQFFMESNGKGVDRSGRFITNYKTGQIVWGAAGTDGQHSFYQLIHQGTRIVPADFFAIARSQNPLPGHHEKLYANALAQPFALAYGLHIDEVKDQLSAKDFDRKNLNWQAAHQTFTGNNPTTSIFIDEMTPRVLGQTIAMYEHQIMAEGAILNIFSFDQWGVELGKVVAKEKVLPYLDGSKPSDELDAVDVGRGKTIKIAVDRFNAKKAESQSSPVGGIDLNAQALDMTTTNEGEFPFPVPTSQMIQLMNQATGFVPTILNIAPIVNLPLILGLVDEGETLPLANHINDPMDKARNEYFDRVIANG